MELIIRGSPKEIAALVLAVQGRQMISVREILSTQVEARKRTATERKDLADTIRDTLEELAKQSSTRQQAAPALKDLHTQQCDSETPDSEHIHSENH